MDRAQPADVGADPAFIDELVSDIRAEKIRNIHGLIILKDDKIITEEYFDEFSRNKLHYTASVSKSFASALLGLAIDHGFFDGDIQAVLDRNVSELFPAYRDLIMEDPLKSGLKLKHLLSMTAGFEWDEHSYPYSDPRNDCHRINHSDDPMKFLFDRKLIHEPGTEFYYNGGLSLAISWLIESWTGKSVDRFAETYLFNALGIKDYRWEEVSGGLIDTDGGLHLKPLDQAKLGYLFLNDGIWQGKQLVSGQWVKECTSVQHLNMDMPDYSYQWWCGDFYVLDKAYYTYMASGHGGQKILVVPELELVMVITQQVFSNPYGDLNFIAMLSDYIIPSLTGGKRSPEKISLPQEDLARFEGNYEALNRDDFVDVEAAEDRLVLRSSDGQVNEFFPMAGDTLAGGDALAGEDAFYGRIMDLITVQIRFETDPLTGAASMHSNFAYSSREFYRSGQSPAR